jgi:hypothetical protein
VPRTAISSTSGGVSAWVISAPAAAVRQEVSMPSSASTAAGTPVVASTARISPLLTEANVLATFTAK